MAGDEMEDTGEGGAHDRGDTQGADSKPVIIDGLLCSILRAMSRSGTSPELASVIERVASESEVKGSWQKLFTHFSDVMDPTRKKKVIDIDRETTKGRVNDILSQLKKIDTENDIRELLVMPWNYVVKPFESDSEERSRIWEEEKSKDYDDRLNTLEKKMDKKHSELLSAIQVMLSDAGRKPGQASFSVPVPNVAFPGQSGSQVSYAGVAAPPSAHLAVPQGGAGGGRVIRSRSPSTKRFRNEDGSTSEVTQANQNSSKKGVVGTSNPAVNGRKMRSPPAAIFVWGVHPETSIDDIVNDLAASDIKIEAKDVEKKSKEEAYLCSYKISVPSDDLSKALNPEIWPIRVKVREFIHYRRKPSGRAGQHEGQANQGAGQKPSGVAHATQGQHGGQLNQATGPYGYPAVGVPGLPVQQASVVHSLPGQQAGGVPSQHAQFYQSIQQSTQQQQQQQQLYPNLSNMFSVLGAPGAPNPNL